MTNILVCASSYPRLQVFIQDVRPLMLALGGTFNSAQHKISLPDHHVTVYLGFIAKAGDEMRYIGREYDYLHIVDVSNVDPSLVARLKPWVERRAVVRA